MEKGIFNLSALLQSIARKSFMLKKNLGALFCSALVCTLLPVATQAQDPAVTSLSPTKLTIDLNEATTIKATFLNGANIAFKPSTQVIWTLNFGPAIEYLGTFTLEDAAGYDLIDVSSSGYDPVVGSIIFIKSKPGVAFPAGNSPGGTNTIYLNVIGKKQTNAEQGITIQAETDPAVGTNNSNNDNLGAHISVTGTLPLQLTKFTAQNEACDAVLDWFIPKNESLSYVEIEYSINGTSFTKIGTLTGNGNDGHYSFRYSPEKGKGLFRLKMIEKNGDYVLSNLESVQGGNCDDRIKVKVFPNPSKDYVTMSGVVAGQQIALYNGDGTLLYIQPVIGNTEKVKLHNYPAGNYLLKVLESGKIVSINKFVKAR